MARLDGKVAVITGATGGIGRAASRLFAEEGAKVALVDLDESALREIAGSIGEDKASYTAADVTDPEQSQAYINEAVNRWGGVDILLANAGIEGTLSPITDYPIEMFDRVMAVNVRGVWLGLKYAMPVMRERGGGSVVITSSTAGISGAAEMSAYNTSKHAVIGLMRVASLEGAPHGIRVNTVNPSPIETRMMRSIEEQRVAAADDSSVTVEVAKTAFSNRIPLQRYGDPTEVARMMLFLSSDDSSFCTGGVYMVDGGRSAGGT